MRLSGVKVGDIIVVDRHRYAKVEMRERGQVMVRWLNTPHFELTGGLRRVKAREVEGIWKQVKR